MSNWLKRFLKIKDNPPDPPAKENAMTVKMVGIYQRKDIDFADVQAMQRAYCLVCRHPYTIANTPDFSAEYASIYGSDELQVLQNSCVGGKFNMVQSPTQAWVIGGVWVPVPPKPEEVLKDGYVWQETPFGRRQVPKTQATVQPAAAVAELTADIKQELAAIVFDNVTAALKAWSQAS